MSLFERSLILLTVLLAVCIWGAAQEPQQLPTADEAFDKPPQSQDAAPDPDVEPPVIEPFHRKFSYGVTFLEGYNASRESSTLSNQDGGTTDISSWSKSSFTGIASYFALDIYRGKTRLNFHSSPVLIYIPTRAVSGGINGFLDPSIGVDVKLSPRLWLSVGAYATYGNQFEQVLSLVSQNCAACSRSPAAATASPQALMVSTGEAPNLYSRTPPIVLSPQNNSGAQAFTSTFFATSGQVTLGWHSSFSQAWSVSARESYATAPWNRGTTDATTVSSTVRLQFGQQITPTVVLSASSGYDRIDSGQLVCTFSGAGLGYQQHRGRFTSWSLEAGAEYGYERACGPRVGGSFSGSLMRTVGEKTSISFNASRGLDTNYYVPGSVWVTSIGAGLHRQIARSTSFELSGGYLDGSRSDIPQSGYSGYVVSPRLIRGLNDYWSLEAQYGYLSGSRPSFSSFNASWAALGLRWQPRPKYF